MKKTLFLLFGLMFSVACMAQLEVKPGSFKEVLGFVNINTDIYEDDNNVLYAVIKVNTENINDKQRRQLMFEGNESTFIELEYKVGEVWVYLSSKPATYLKISHPTFGSTEFWFPYDLQPKKGYELVLVNKASSQSSGYGSLTVITKPESGATITMNGQVLSYKTPYTNDMVAAGQYEITVSKEKFSTVTKQVTIQDGDKQVVEIDIAANVALVTVYAANDTYVFIDGKRMKLGTWSGELLVGEHKVFLSKGFNEIAEKTIMVKGSENQTVDLTLSDRVKKGDKYAEITIQTDDDAWTYIDGEALIYPGTHVVKMHPGNYKIKCQKAYYTPDSLDITVVANHKATYAVNLKPIMGKIEIVTEPAGADVNVDYITDNGIVKKYYGVTPLIINDIEIKTWMTIKLSKKGYITWERAVNNEKEYQKLEMKMVEFPPEGSTKELFSVSPNVKVCFAKGNLQYQASTKTWRFAEHQWDVIGDANANISETNSGWIDLFGGKTGNNPTNCAEEMDKYKNGCDWGNNVIINGGNYKHVWKTLTEEEWDYVLNKRQTASGIKYVWATVNNVPGIILLPDSWNASTYQLQNVKPNGNRYADNIISSTVWTSKLEPKGAVFLPAAGWRKGKSVENVGVCGYYWTYTENSKKGSNGRRYLEPDVIQFEESKGRVDPLYHPSYVMGMSVRLVCHPERGFLWY